MHPIALEPDVQDYGDDALYAEWLPGQVSAAWSAMRMAWTICQWNLGPGDPEREAWLEAAAVLREASQALPYPQLRPRQRA